jgi:hypothetical protein
MPYVAADFNPAEWGRIVAPAFMLPCCGLAASMLMNNPG